jgi:phage terminase large subunit-like protein
MKRGPKAAPTVGMPALRAKTPAARVVEFCRRFLTHTRAEWRGQPLVLAAWQIERLINPLYDTLRPDGLRQYRVAFLEVPRKNGKSLLAAALGLYSLICDGEPGAEVAVAATDRAQAGLLFADARAMVEANETLRQVVQVYRNELFVPATNSRFRVLSSEAPRAHGLSLSTMIYDELHAAPNRDLWDALVTSMAARRQPLSIAITTAGFDKNSICYKLHEHAERVLETPDRDPEFLPVLYGAAPEDDWTDPVVWRRVNPGYDVSVKADFLQAECRRAKEVPSAQNAFRRLHLNVWTESETRWLDAAAWNACAGAVPSREELRGRKCFVGVDLSSTKDLSALVAIFPDGEGGYDVICDTWLPGDNLHERVRRDRVPLDVWAMEGYLTLSGGNTIDQDLIEQRIRDLGERDGFAVERIGCDPWNLARMLPRLQADGIPAVPVPQTIAGLTAATKRLETLVLQRKLRHGGHPILAWCAANVVVVQDHNENLKPDKGKSTERIDLISALVNAFAVETRDATSIYESRGVVAL